MLGLDHGSTVNRLADLENKVAAMSSHVAAVSATVNAIESHQPAVLNAIASVNGNARLLARETNGLREELLGDREKNDLRFAELTSAEARHVAHEVSVGRALEAFESSGSSQQQRIEEAWVSFQRGDDSVREDFRPHIETIGWLLQRVETIRAEMMHELRYGAKPDADSVVGKIVNPSSLDTANIRLNIGAGHISLDGFVNVDIRELPGIDVVASVDSLPFEQNTVSEIFSSHTLEHFPELELRRRLLPYWFGLLAPGGVFRAVTPDLAEMSKAYALGKISFDVLRAVAYGGQEYQGDFHFNGFSPQSLCRILDEAGFTDSKVVAKDRVNGDCIEFEVSALKPIN